MLMQACGYVYDRFCKVIERFSYDLEMKTRKQNRNNKRTEIARFDWFIERIQTRLAFGLLSERSDEKTSCLQNFLEIIRYLAFTSYCNTIGQSNSAFSILGFFFFSGKTKRPCFDLFIHWLLRQITNTCRNHFSRSYVNVNVILKCDHSSKAHFLWYCFYVVQVGSNFQVHLRRKIVYHSQLT